MAVVVYGRRGVLGIQIVGGGDGGAWKTFETRPVIGRLGAESLEKIIRLGRDILDHDVAVVVARDADVIHGILERDCIVRVRIVVESESVEVHAKVEGKVALDIVIFARQNREKNRIRRGESIILVGCEAVFGELLE